MAALCFQVIHEIQQLVNLCYHCLPLPLLTHIRHTIFQDHRAHISTFFINAPFYLHFALKWKEFVIFFVSNLGRNVTL